MTRSGGEGSATERATCWSLPTGGHSINGGGQLTRHRTFEELGSPLPAGEFQAATDAIVANIEQVIEGKTATVRLALAVMLAEGHLLIEDVPGVGKTKLAKALARSIDCSVRRIQFTPDLLPSDVTGVSVYNQENREFEFKPGAVFANIVVGDEINRASPKTQSALLECMEERQVTVDGVTYPLQVPFMVVATQNPIEMEGTYPLPEAQRDRFTARIAMGYPDAGAELAMLDIHGGHDAARRPDAGLRRDPGPPHDRDRPRHPRGRRGQAVRGQPRHRHPRVARPSPRRLAPRHPAAAAHRPRGGRAGGARLRPARRPADAGRAGARPPHHPDRRGAAVPPDDRRDRRRPRAPAAAADRPPTPLALRHPAPRPAVRRR